MWCWLHLSFVVVRVTGWTLLDWRVATCQIDEVQLVRLTTCKLSDLWVANCEDGFKLVRLTSLTGWSLVAVVNYWRSDALKLVRLTSCNLSDWRVANCQIDGFKLVRLTSLAVWSLVAAINYWELDGLKLFRLMSCNLSDWRVATFQIDGFKPVRLTSYGLALGCSFELLTIWRVEICQVDELNLSDWKVETCQVDELKLVRLTSCHLHLKWKIISPECRKNVANPIYNS